MKEPAKEQIEQRAYELYVARGCEAGMDVDDWLAAEKELIFEGVLSEPQIEAMPVPEIKRHVPKIMPIAVGQSA